MFRSRKSATSHLQRCNAAGARIAGVSIHRVLMRFRDTSRIGYPHRQGGNNRAKF
jgi:hypothetical protein